MDTYIPSPENTFEPTEVEEFEWRKMYHEHFYGPDRTTEDFNFVYKQQLVQQNKLVDIVPLDFSVLCYRTRKLYNELKTNNKSEIIDGDTTTLFRRLVQFVGPMKHIMTITLESLVVMVRSKRTLSWRSHQT